MKCHSPFSEEKKIFEVKILSAEIITQHVEYQGDWIGLVYFFVLSVKRDNFCDFLFALLHVKPLMLKSLL